MKALAALKAKRAPPTVEQPVVEVAPAAAEPKVSWARVVHVDVRMRGQRSDQ